MKSSKSILILLNRHTGLRLHNIEESKDISHQDHCMENGECSCVVGEGRFVFLPEGREVKKLSFLVIYHFSICRL